MRVVAQVKSPSALVCRRLPTCGDAGHRRKRLRIVIGQPFKERAHGIRVGRRGRKRRIESLRQPAIAPTKLLLTRRAHPTVIKLALFRLKTTARTQQRDTQQHSEPCAPMDQFMRSEEHTSELQSLAY